MRLQRYVVLVGREAAEFYFWTRKDAMRALAMGLDNVPEVGFTAWDRWTDTRLVHWRGREQQ